ncbi:hypothetical protein Zmor_021055 [Zophobas morio]|uniref:Uncharacterized protein n=1 Tax=Zophobas morio TaxID=2755281 RepID=A0AA38I8K7_9CUCU|nr:hypothetical protein Zmor_021055 [Zophobas morio]
MAHEIKALSEYKEETYMRPNPAAAETPAGTVCPIVKPSFYGRNASWFPSEVESHLRDHLQTSFFKRFATDTKKSGHLFPEAEGFEGDYKLE